MSHLKLVRVEIEGFRKFREPFVLDLRSPENYHFGSHSAGALRQLVPTSQVIVATYADDPWSDAMSWEWRLLVDTDDLRAQVRETPGSAFSCLTAS